MGIESGSELAMTPADIELRDAENAAIVRKTKVVSEIVQLVRAVTETQEWMEDANCRGVDPELFFPEKGETINEARAVCGGCRVAKYCLDYALGNGIKNGVWGGTSELDRRRIRRERKEVA